MIHRATLAAAAVALALAACNDSDNVLENNLVPGEPVTNTASDMVPVAATPNEYAAFMAGIDQYEIDSARLALDKSDNPAIRELAQDILTDHQTSLGALRTAATEVDPPIVVGTNLTPEQQRDLDALRGEDGAEFERLWLLQQVAAHEEAFAFVTDYATEGRNSQMSEHASSVRQPIYRHLGVARELARSFQQQQE